MATDVRFKELGWSAPSDAAETQQGAKRVHWTCTERPWQPHESTASGANGGGEAMSSG